MSGSGKDPHLSSASVFSLSMQLPSHSPSWLSGKSPSSLRPTIHPTIHTSGHFFKEQAHCLVAQTRELKLLGDRRAP